MKPEERISFKINVVSNLIMRNVDNIISKKYKLMQNNSIVTGTTGKIIGYIYFNGQKDIFQKNIEEAFQIRRSTASKILKALEAKGFIIRIPCGDDGRLKKIILTEKALAFHNLVNNTIEYMELKILYGISEEELKIFLKVLDKIKNNIIE